VDYDKGAVGSHNIRSLNQHQQEEEEEDVFVLSGYSPFRAEVWCVVFHNYPVMIFVVFIIGFFVGLATS
jgi:peroxiredoxin